eukprot:m.185182 g.185182  ORF g.185182 m.185182 type:complete len:552 (-) comp16368_c0_seq1:167-1822(-)
MSTQENAPLLQNEVSGRSAEGNRQVEQGESSSGRERSGSVSYNDHDSHESTPAWMRTLLILLPLTAVVGAIAVVTWAAVANESTSPNAQEFEASVTTEAIMAHLDQFQTIAKTQGNGSRSITTGYEASAEYVEDALNTSNYFRLSRQYFPALVWEQNDPAMVIFYPQGLTGPPVDVPTTTPHGPAGDAEATTLRYSGTTNGVSVDSEVVFIPGGLCRPEEFAPAAGKFALVYSNFSSSCDYYRTAVAAQAANVTALLVARNEPGMPLPSARVRDSDWTPNSTLIHIPCLGLSYTMGALLLAQPATVVSIGVDAEQEVVDTFNVIAEVGGTSRAAETVVVGAHLDSVPQGPGINDNGSGSASVLEMALQFQRLGLKPMRTTRFVWYGAEEVGLLGSRHYVRSLDDHELGNTTAMLNFDMLGSPNYVRIVYDGNGCPEESRASCVILQGLFTTFFTQNNLPYDVSPFSTTGGSDYFPFVRAGVPAASIATGAGGIKSDTQRQNYGGLSKTAYDPCYHMACDTTENINFRALAEMSQAAAYAVIHTVNYNGDLR